MNGQPCLDAKISRRDFGLLSSGTVVQVRNLCRHPDSGEPILWERLMNGCRALDEYETDARWQLFELILCGWMCCVLTQREAREARLQSEAYQQSRRRLRALNHRSTKAYLEHERGRQVPPPTTDIRQPYLIRRHSKE